MTTDYPRPRGAAGWTHGDGTDDAIFCVRCGGLLRYVSGTPRPSVPACRCAEEMQAALNARRFDPAPPPRRSRLARWSRLWPALYAIAAYAALTAAYVAVLAWLFTVIA